MALNVVALVVGDPGAPELWALRRLAECPCTLHVVQARAARTASTATRARRLVREHGLLGFASRALGGRLIGARELHRQRRALDRLFDGDDLRAWWAGAGYEPVDVPSLNHADARAAIAALAPDIIVRVSGGILRRETFALARIATLNIHHGMAPTIRGMWSIPWGIVEGRADWIGATVHVIDEGIDTGAVLWRGAPQVAAGDTAATLFFRAHVEAVDALSRLVRNVAGGAPLAPLEPIPAATAASTYRSAPGLGAWLRYLRVGRGARAPVVIESAIR